MNIPETLEKSTFLEELIFDISLFYKISIDE